MSYRVKIDEVWYRSLKAAIDTLSPVSERTVRSRIERGWSVREAVLTPAGGYRQQYTNPPKVKRPKDIRVAVVTSEDGRWVAAGEEDKDNTEVAREVMNRAQKEGFVEPKLQWLKTKLHVAQRRRKKK